MLKQDSLISWARNQPGNSWKHSENSRPLDHFRQSNKDVGPNVPLKTVSGSRYSCPSHFKQPEHILSCSHWTHHAGNKTKTVTKSIAAKSSFGNNEHQVPSRQVVAHFHRCLSNGRIHKCWCWHLLWTFLLLYPTGTIFDCVCWRNWSHTHCTTSAELTPEQIWNSRYFFWLKGRNIICGINRNCDINRSQRLPGPSATV